MGSALLLVIVLGWALLIVPMLVHRPGQVSEPRRRGRVSAGLRSLARRPSPSTREAVVPARLAPARRSPAAARAARVARRRRSLLILATLAVALLLLALVAPLVWIAQVAVDVALVAYVVHLRREAVFDATVRHRRELARRVAAQPAASRTAASRHVAARPAASRRVAGSAAGADAAGRIPGTPAVPAAGLVELGLAEPEAVPTAAVAQKDSGWQPRPLPLPTYLSAPRAVPARAAEVFDQEAVPVADSGDEAWWYAERRAVGD